MVEAVILLPVLGLLLMGALHLHRMHAASGQLVQRTRHCALVHARAGCRPEAVAPECDGAFTSAGEPGRVERDALARDTADAIDRAGARTSLFERAGELPLLGAAIEGLFGRGERASLSTEAPGLVGRGPLRLSASHHVLCDVIPSDASGVARQLFDALTTF